MTENNPETQRRGLVKVTTRRLRHFARKRRYAAILKAADHYDAGDSMQKCQEHEVLACCSNCKSHWYVMHTCRQRLCPLCSWQTTKRRTHFIKQLTKHMKFPKMLTLTMPTWTEDPRDGIDALRAGWNKLRRNPLLSDVQGGCYTIELKRKPNGWHIHMHAILDAPFLPWRPLVAAWGKAIGVYQPTVDIRAADSDKAKEYCAKYATKAMDYKGEALHLLEWYEATKGLRLFATFGTFYNATIDDLLNEHDEPETPACCPFCHQPKTVFLARAGPWIYGPEIWDDVKPIFVGSAPESKAIPEIVDMVEAKLKQQEEG